MNGTFLSIRRYFFAIMGAGGKDEPYNSGWFRMIGANCYLTCSEIKAAI
jgi:hypothetical protein